MKSKNNEPKLRYIAYIRKSEERKERQELSHKAQVRKIKEQFPGLKVVKWFEESKSAFKPGRPLFKEMMGMIESGEAEGIVSYHPNRCSRNEIDSAEITYALRGKLKDLKFCTYTFENSAEGIMWLQFTMN
jgi:site-specific DNA recombinase